MLHRVQVAAPPAVCWELLADPQRWPEWAPWLPVTAPALTPGQHVRLRGLGLALPVRIVAVDPGERHWSWKAGTVSFGHFVRPLRGRRSEVIISLRGPGARALNLAYGPVIQLALRRLARIAEGG